MTFLITPTSELEAVNECLENIGQAPVSTIAGDLGVDTQIALSFVRKVNRELQSQGWFWNTEKDFPLTPGGDDNILLPSNTLAVDTTGASVGIDAIQRGSRLYNRTDHSYTFTAAVYVELTVGLTFEELPETARRYVALRAARIFQDRIEGGVSQSDATDEESAWASLMADQLRTEDVNVLSGSFGMFQTLNRS
jgi:hypothetical protein